MVDQCRPRRNARFFQQSPSAHSAGNADSNPGIGSVRREYAAQTITTAKALGLALTDEGVNVEAKEFGFTESHQLAINVTNFGVAKDIARSLADQNNIITNFNMLPGDKDAKNPTGLRIGVQEMTRYGMKAGEMGELAALTKAGLQGKIVKDEVIKLRSRFTDVHFA